MLQNQVVQINPTSQLYDNTQDQISGPHITIWTNERTQTSNPNGLTIQSEDHIDRTNSCLSQSNGLDDDHNKALFVQWWAEITLYIVAYLMT